MFPSESREHVAGVLNLHGMAGALDLLLQTKPTTSSLQTPEVCMDLYITQLQWGSINGKNSVLCFYKTISRSFLEAVQTVEQ